MVFGQILFSLLAQEGLATLKSSSVNYTRVRADIMDVMTDPSWDDGSYAPQFIRLAWHSSGTYDKSDRTGGSNGATMRYALQSSDPQNKGLHFARDLLEPIKQRHTGLSYSDLWILASYVALEATNGPKIEFRSGRVDADEDKAIAPGRMPDAERGLAPGLHVDSQNRLKGWENLAQHMRDIFGRIGLDDKEMVALISGGHAYGRCHREYTGYEGTWMGNPLYFSTEYVEDMIGDQWQAVSGNTKLASGAYAPDDLRPSSAKRQYIDLTTLDPTADALWAGMRADDHLATLEAKNHTPGQYRVSPIWVNVREAADAESPILVRLQQGTKLSIIAFKTDEDGRVRGLAVQGGWVSIITDGGSEYLERIGDLDMKILGGEFRMLQLHPAPAYASAGQNSAQIGSIPAGSEFECLEMRFDGNGALYGQVSTGGWVMVYSSDRGLIAEKKVRNWNEVEHRKPQKDQYSHQMMLVSDMVLKWDHTLRSHLEVYNTEDGSGEVLLREDFGKAFKKLTELGCPWTPEATFGI